MNRTNRRKHIHKQKTVQGLKINSPEANAEFEAMHNMVNKDNEEILAMNKKHQELIGSQEPNWALFNYVMSLVSFEHCNSKMDAMHILWRHIWPHFHQITLENELMKEYLLNGKPVPMSIGIRLKSSVNPEKMAEQALQCVADVAKKRAKLKSYQIALEKDPNAKILNE